MGQIIGACGLALLLVLHQGSGQVRAGMPRHGIL
jgi:hypothetical protein